MPPIYFASGNAEKQQNAQHVCELAGIELIPVALDIDEIQGEDPTTIVQAKAKAAFELFSQPIMVSDDSWHINALNGFPGAYMKSVNHWFKPDDFLRLMDGVQDRSVVLRQNLAYFDGAELVVFSEDVHGEVLPTNFGDETKAPWMNVVSMDGDNGKSLAEVFNQPAEKIKARYEKRPEVWSAATDWYKKKYS